MKNIGDSLGSEYLAKFSGKKAGPNSERADVVEQAMNFMGEKTFKYWLGRTRHLTPYEILTRLKQAQRWQTNPKALFNKLIKKKKSEKDTTKNKK